MKNKILLYFAGVLTGIALALLTTLLFAKNNLQNNKTPIETYPGITIFDQPADTLKFSQFEVFQVIKNNMALAHCYEPKSEALIIETGPTVLLIDEDKYYYDDEIINVPQSMQALHVGVFQYQTNQGTNKTIPVIKIMQ
ncbi:hypothetical protein [Alistipes sp.]|uniref:hypothetical protein n=1 Tax=Alistipes sp. TaxID=1872444 RepID=UPI0025C07B1D|nr:hypothetical protein [Alistipes sp.]